MTPPLYKHYTQKRLGGSSYLVSSRNVGARPESVEKRGVVGLATFTRSIIVQRKIYRFTMVGSDPFLARSRQVVVPLQIVPVRVMFNDGTALDPTVPGPDCAGAGDPLTITLGSPLFTDKDYGEEELAFFSWFFDQVPSLGLEGLYSWGGTLTSPVGW